MRILLHMCCAACSIGPVEQMAAGGHDVTGYYYNPNVHPLIEHRRRLKAVKVMQERLPVPVVFEERYGLEDYLEAVDWRSGDRCAHCYRLRLERTAQVAAERGCDAMTTTLLASTQQDHELVRRIGREAAAGAGVEFHYADWRRLAEEGHRRAREMNLYLQSYCGCLFSECERFRETARHLYRGPGPLRSPQ